MSIYRSLAAAAVLSASLLISTSTFAQSPAGDRAQTWDLGVQLFNQGSLDLGGREGSGLDIDSEFGWGFWGNYNFTNRFALGFELNWVRPDYSATFVPEDDPDPITIDHTLSVFNFQGKGTFNFLEGPITPYVELGFGWTDVDSNVASGPPVTGCWWDPWWGYICSNFFSTYSDTLTSYSYAGGVRWDINQWFGLRGSYGILELDTASGTENADFEMLKLELTWRF